MLSVHLSVPFLLLSLLATFGSVLPAPTTNKPVPTCFTSKIDLALKWPVTLTTEGDVPVNACNGTVLGQVTDAGYAALKTTRVGILPNQLSVFMPNSTCFLPLATMADAKQIEAIGTPFSAVSTRSVPCGTTLYIPALDGIVLPHGSGVHNGCVRAVNRQAEIRTKCEAVLNIGSAAHASLFNSVAGETAIEIKDCVPGEYTSLQEVETAGDVDDLDEEFDYPDPTSASASGSAVTAGEGDSASEDDASYSLSEVEEAGSVDASTSTSDTVEYVDCDENGVPISAGSQASSSSGNIQYVYVDCDENGNPIVGSGSMSIQPSPAPIPAPADSQASLPHDSASGSDADVVYVDCDENGNPIVGSGSMSIQPSPAPIPAPADSQASLPHDSASGSDAGVVYVDCDENGNPIVTQ